MAKVLIIGGGGREHALGWKLAQSPQVECVFYAPGNGGTAVGKGVNLPFDGAKRAHFEEVFQVIQAEDIALTVVGPEAPLTDGLVDFLMERGVKGVFGPTRQAAQLEADKFFSFDVMERLGVPQAKGLCCTSFEEALAAIPRLTTAKGVVLKARGLAAGKGVVVCDTAAEAEAALPALVEAYGPDVLVSERLSGPEFSVFAICDGGHFVPLEMAFQDHKRLLDGDLGPNTGGMGAYGPAPIASQALLEVVYRSTIKPIIRYFQMEGSPYRGFLYAGMMLTEEGPKVLEYNVRFGDPECQPAMVMLESDLYELLSRAVDGSLEQVKPVFRPGAACCVVMASQGYPGAVQKGLLIEGLEAAQALEGVEVFHAGTRRDGDGTIRTYGGRVLGVTAYAEAGLAEAQAKAYQAVHCISVAGGLHYRTDIANKALAKQEVHIADE